MSLFEIKKYQLVCDTRGCTASTTIEQTELSEPHMPEGWSQASSFSVYFNTSRFAHYCPTCTKERATHGSL